MGYLVNSPFIEGLSTDAVCRQYIFQVPSKLRSGTSFASDLLLETIAEAYMAAGYQLHELQKASRPVGDTRSTAASRPLPMTVPRTLTMFPSNPMPTSHISPMPTLSAAPMPLSACEPMNVDSIGKLRKKLHSYTGERKGDRQNCHENREVRRCYNCGGQAHLARDCQKTGPSSRGREGRGSRSGTPRREHSRDSKGQFRSRSKSRERPTTASQAFRRPHGGRPREELYSTISPDRPEQQLTLGSAKPEYVTLLMV